MHNVIDAQMREKKKVFWGYVFFYVVLIEIMCVRRVREQILFVVYF